MNLRKILKAVFFIFAACLLSCAGKSAPGTFGVGDKTFLLNGGPFVIKAAEMHYTRIPPEYWEHRIRMCKAMGMNTVCLYVFWNFHEQNPGEFDFTEGRDILQFCRLAQKHDMWVILRPGPYVCAEWEMGGLPWWLLKKDGIELRSNDPYYLERCGIYMNRIGEQLADMQITRGGNILMVQVENEFGAYGTDKEYMANVRDMVRRAGFTDVPLFQCDWSSNFENNTLDDLIWTINFGTGVDIDGQFARLEQLRPDAPLMCSEFWSGWFDHWGRNHETRSSDALVGGLRDMLDRDISFSLYMAHGGTTFAHWGGANSPPYSAMCSSYDYDAPVSEAGHVTEKFHMVRSLMENYLREGERLPAIPEQLPMAAIKEFNIESTAPLFSNLPEPVLSEDVHPMEYFNQGWGTILYRTKLPADTTGKGAVLVITDPHDWTQVFIDGELVGTLDRRRGETWLEMPSWNEGAVLDILVEAMGRVNFDKAIHDRKGITARVEIVSGESIRELKGWEVYSLPADYDFAASRSYDMEAEAVEGPAWYRAVFNVDKPADTFLDMQTWGKGLVWVNGHGLGRFWWIGPQQTLYLPGCWLKKGENEIIILDLAGPDRNVVRGITEPVLDMLREKTSSPHNPTGRILDLGGFIPVLEGEFAPGNNWQEFRFGKSVKGRYFCLESLDSHTGDNFASMAELEILGADGRPLARMDWKLAYADSEEILAANNSADKIFDLQETTFWHTEYGLNRPPHPHRIIIDMGGLKNISGFRYLPRPEPNANGMIKGFRVFVEEGEF